MNFILTNTPLKRLLLCLALLPLSGVAVAQKSFILSYQPKNGFLTAAAGAVLPLGSFAAQSPGVAGSGLALPGLMAQVSAGYRLLGPVGLMARAEYSQLAIQTQDLANRPVADEAIYDWQAIAGRWQTMTVLVGPFVSIPLGRFSLDARVLTGRVRATCPAVNIIGQSADDELITINTEQTTATTTATGAGLSLRYRLGRVLALNLNGDYTQADVPFHDVTTVSRIGFRTQTTRAEGRQQIQTLSLSFGMTVLFTTRQRMF
jgi:hypothetical protein